MNSEYQTPPPPPVQTLLQGLRYSKNKDGCFDCVDTINYNLI